MKFLDRLFSRKQSVWDRWIQLMDMGGQTKAGPTVNRENIWRVSAAMACMAVRARGMAQVPFKLFQKRKSAACGASKRRANTRFMTR